MAKAYIDGQWVDVPTASLLERCETDFSAELSGLEELKNRCAALTSSASELSLSALSTAVTTPKKIGRYVFTDTSYSMSQGGCTDGTYVYSICNKYDTQPSTIAKLKLSDMSVVKTKSGLYLYHANDITYCPDDGLLYVATMAPVDPDSTPGQIVVINPDTLGIVKHYHLGWSPSGVAYEKRRGIFVGGGDWPHFRIFVPTADNPFNSHYRLTVDQSPAKDAGWTSQGIACDDLYLYHALSSADAKQWCVEVVNWSGKYCGVLSGNQSKEIEWVDKLGTKEFIIGLTSSGSRDCTTYSFST